MNEIEGRNPDGTWKEGFAPNPEGKNGHTAGWQRYGTRLQRFLEMPGDELKALADDEKKLLKLATIDIGAIRHAKEIGFGDHMLEYLNAALDRLEGKAVQRNELTGKDGGAIDITSEHRELIRSKLLFLRLPKIIRERRIAELSDAEVEALRYDWQFWGRPEQFAPLSDWTYWFVMAGRGFGKTRTGAEWVREQVKTSPLVNLVGATADDARDVMIKGESGILAICPKDERPRYVDSELRWPNGAKSLVFTADEPDRLRGKQHMKLWADELAAWRYPDAWDQAMLGLRLGGNPQAIITSTPKPTKIIRDLLRDPATAVTRGSTYDNLDNLAPSFFKKIISKYEGTRLGRQELNAEVLDDMPGALWKRSDIDASRVNAAPALARVVVAIDPAGSTNEGSDETGIVVAGKGVDGRFYVLADLSGKFSPDGWGREAVSGYKRYQADRIVGEVNNGGDMVKHTVHSVDANVAFKEVRASRGKATRAEPVSALYEQGKVSHVGCLPTLEDQMCIFTSDYDRAKAKFSPDRMDALVWAVHELGIEGSPGDNILEYWQQRDAERKK